jgi:hypothetical protein
MDMRAIARVLGALAAAALLALLAVSQAGAFELNGGCTLDISSSAADGGALDAASGAPGGGQGGTQGDPFLVDWDGTVSWLGTSGSQVIRDHTWGVSVYGIPTPVRGGDPNEGGDTTGEGATGVGENAPFPLVGVFHVSGDINGAEGAHCDGNGWFRLQGNPFATIPFWVAVAIALIGLALLWSSRASQTAAAVTSAVSPETPPAYEPPPPSSPDDPTETAWTPPSEEDRR